VSRRDERGAATLLVLVMVGVLATMAVAGAVIGGILVGQRRASSAADLAALAGAEALRAGGGSVVAGSAACDDARHVATMNGAQLRSCRASGAEVELEVVVEVRSAWGRTWAVPGRARAGLGGATEVGAASPSTGPGP
jgi:secretion/DNA translocation related TadE-like protein